MTVVGGTGTTKGGRMSQTAYRPVRHRTDPAGLRVSHAERDHVVDGLQTAFGEGRIDKGEFDERVGRALAARTRADLDGLLGDLAAPPSAASHAAPHRPDSEERAWAMLSHWLGLLTWVVGPGIIAVTKGRTSAFVRAQAIEALNFQITFGLAVLVFPLVAIFTLGIGMLLYLAAPVVMIAIGFAALAGSASRYPLCLRLIR